MLRLCLFLLRLCRKLEGVSLYSCNGQDDGRCGDEVSIVWSDFRIPAMPKFTHLYVAADAGVDDVCAWACTKTTREILKKRQWLR